MCGHHAQTCICSAHSQVSTALFYVWTICSCRHGSVYRRYAGFLPASKGSAMLSQSKHWSGSHQVFRTCFAAPDAAPDYHFKDTECHIYRKKNILSRIRTLQQDKKRQKIIWYNKISLSMREYKGVNPTQVTHCWTLGQQCPSVNNLLGYVFSLKAVQVKDCFKTLHQVYD